MSTEVISASSEVSLRGVSNVLRRQRWVILACVVLSLGAGVAFALLRTRVYEASSLILVDEERSGVPTLDLLEARPTGNQVGTEIAVLRSRVLAASVVDSLQLQLQISSPRSAVRSGIFSLLSVPPESDLARYRFVREHGRFAIENVRSGERLGSFAPGERVRLGKAVVALDSTALRYPEVEADILPHHEAIDELTETLQVNQPSREASIIQVKYRGRDPELVRDVPNVLATRFLILRHGVQTGESRSMAEFLREQLDTLSTQLASAEDELQSFRQRAQVINPQEEGSTQIQRLATLQAERGALESERAALAQLLREVQAADEQRASGPSPYRRLIAFPSLLRNQAASELLRSLSTVENERATLLTRRDPSDPDVQVLTTRINELESQLRTLVTTYLQGLTNQVAAVDGNLRQFQQQLNRIPANEVRLARLSRRSKALESIHGTLQTRLKEVEVAQAANDPSVRVVDSATLPTRPVSPRKTLLVAFSALFGLIFGAGLGWMREQLDDSVRTRGDLQIATGMPVLGLIPRMSGLTLAERRIALLPRGAKRLGGARDAVAPATTGEVNTRAPSVALAHGTDAPDPFSDAYDRLHTNILFARPDTEPRILLLTSPLPADGKTTNAANLATTLVQRGLKVLLIDADLRRGTVNSWFGIGREPGLTEFLNGIATLAEAVHPVEVGGGRILHCIPTGRVPQNPAQLVGSPQMAALLNFLAQQYDKIILDSPPLNIVADAALLARNVDGVIIVARAGATPFEALVYAAEQFRNSNMPVLGTLLNDVDFDRDASYDSAYRWYGRGQAYYSVPNSG